MTKISRDYFQTLNRPQTEYLTFEYATFEADVWEAIRGNPLVLSVGLHRCKGLRNADLAFLATLPNLRQFYVCDSKLNGSFLQYLNALSTTYLSANYSLFPKENFRYLRDFGALEHLSLKKSGLDETIFSEIAANKRRQKNAVERTRRRFVDAKNALKRRYILARKPAITVSGWSE